MRFLFIIQKLYNGGAERVVARLASALSARHEVAVALTDEDPYLHGKYETDPRVRLIHMPPPHTRIPLGPLFRPLAAVTRVRGLRRIKSEFAPDVSVSFLSSPNLYNVLSGKDVPTVISIRNMMSLSTYHNWLGTRFRNVCDRYSAGRATRIVTVSRRVAEDQIRVFGTEERKLRTIYNPLDWESVYAASRAPVEDEAFERFRADHRRLIVSVGRLTEQKAQWQLIRALREVRAVCPDAGLVLFGMGELRERLERVTADNGLEEHVYLAGYRIAPFAYLGKADLFVLSSLFEGFSNAMLEAMGCGLPIVSVDGVSGPRELLAPDTDCMTHTEEIEYAPFGVLTPPLSGDLTLNTEPCERAESLLARAIAGLLTDDGLRERYRQRSLQRIRDFSMENITKQWEALCAELARGDGKTAG